MAYELIAGTPPFRSAVYYELANQHIHSPLPAYPAALDVPQWYQNLVQTLTEKDPLKRTISAEDVATLLSTHLSEGELRGHAELLRSWRAKEQRLAALRRRRARRRRRIVFAAVLVLVVLIYAAFCRTDNRQWRLAATPVLSIENRLGAAGSLLMWPARQLLGIHFSVDDPLAYQKMFDEIAVRDQQTEQHIWDRAARDMSTLAAVRGWDGSSVTVQGLTIPIPEAIVRFGPEQALDTLVDEGGLDPNVRDAAGDPLVFRTIHEYRQNPVYRLILARGFDPERRDHDGDTPWHAAIRWVNNPALHALGQASTERGWNADVRDSKGRTPLELLLSLASDAQKPLLEELWRGAPDLWLRNQAGELPIEQAAETASEPAIQFLLDIHRRNKDKNPSWARVVTRLKNRQMTTALQSMVEYGFIPAAEMSP